MAGGIGDLKFGINGHNPRDSDLREFCQDQSASQLWGESLSLPHWVGVGGSAGLLVK